MNRNSFDREVYLLLSSFLAEVEAFSTNRSNCVDLINPEPDIQDEKEVPNENENLNQPGKPDRHVVLLDVRDLSKARILKKYYRLLLLLDHVKHAKIISQLDFLYECFTHATYDIELVPDVGCFIRDLVDEIKLNRLQTSH